MSSRIRLSEELMPATGIKTVWGEELVAAKHAIPEVSEVEKRQTILTNEDQARLQQEFSERQQKRARAGGESFTNPTYDKKGQTPQEGFPRIDTFE